ncbi:MAG: chemotaxis protein CheW [Pseudomonadota bacterium]
MMEHEAVEAVIVQLDEGSILLPRSVFLEVTTRAGAVQLDAGHSEVPWLGPSLIWQDVQVPVVNVQQLLAPERDTGSDQRRFTRLLVMQSLSEPERMPFYALEVRGTPHPVRITPHNIYALEGVESHPWSWRVKASGVSTHLLRLDLVEQQLLELGTAEPA